ncbi:MAG: hypothetical protein ABR910_00670 [Acidobacteriaceae bacterium]
MHRPARPLALSMASLLVAVALTTAHASPLPHPGIHQHPALKDPITITIANQRAEAQEIKIGGRIYALKPHASLTIKLPPGTQVFAASPGPGVHEGDVLFAVTPALNDATVKIN